MREAKDRHTSEDSCCSYPGQPPSFQGSSTTSPSGTGGGAAAFGGGILGPGGDAAAFGFSTIFFATAFGTTSCFIPCFCGGTFGGGRRDLLVSCASDPQGGCGILLFGGIGGVAPPAVPRGDTFGGGR